MYVLASVNFGEKVFGKMYVRPNVHSGKYQFWKISFWGNVHWAKYTFCWQLSILENTVSFRGNAISAKCIFEQMFILENKFSGKRNFGKMYIRTNAIFGKRTIRKMASVGSVNCNFWKVHVQENVISG